MKRAIRGLMWVMLSTALVVMAPRAFAQRPPETHPVSTHQDIVMSWDRSAMPGDVELVPPRTVLGHDPLDSERVYGGLHLVCESSTDSAKGLCPTADTEQISPEAGRIPLAFTEQRSGMRVNVPVLAAIERVMNGRQCRGDFWHGLIYLPWSSRNEDCLGDLAVGTGLHLSIPESDLARLVAGIWSARLELQLDSAISRGLATYSFDLAFTVTDHNAVAIYFPQFDEIAPHVGMNLRYDPIAHTVGGGTTVDMCLYDGLGSQAAYLGVTVRDSGARAPGPLGFSAWHRDSGGSGESERLDYTVTLDHSGALIPMRNGVEEQLTGIDSAKLKLVLLPGMSQPVFCVPTPLRLEMPRVPIAEKQPGYYRGDLKVELRVPTGVP
ncbi:CfaE/CblD family pilus tip adhesin [Stenotrophomonas sp. C4297]|uniref:CfaE/CblD family pilus tip adhesin n=1 Tax=Stenotrophomonas sp. C4297 TaxID=3077847 RepID=UPI00293D1070|nr:CfaE/CblD family pilus tip adhesin [Stenotrophomonas sp. C4297]MDV3511576.1 CfaE/CblD family pilus tip adhesin [Stenotrophomonas sp. C4297]